MLNGVAPVDTSYIRQSAMEIGNVLKDAVGAQMEEVNSILSLQAQYADAVATMNSAADMMEASSGMTIDMMA